MKRCYRVMLGSNSVHAGECVDGGFIGSDHLLSLLMTIRG